MKNFGCQEVVKARENLLLKVGARPIAIWHVSMRNVVGMNGGHKKTINKQR